MTTQWKPACHLQQLHSRAKMLAKIRTFFARRKVIEVETPLLCHATATDPQLAFFSSVYCRTPHKKQMYLQSSPEFAMKRLLAAGSGSIYQICKAFRNGEFGHFHNPEFSILEWYRVNYSLRQLMAETIELLRYILVGHDLTHCTELSYQQLFKTVTGLNAFVFCPTSYKAYAKHHKLTDAIDICENNHAAWLDFIFSHRIQPSLAQYPLCIIHSYPALQPSLARTNVDNPLIVDRFEVFIKGIEIGNGFLELADSQEQEMRFDRDNKARTQQGLATMKKDNYLLAALSDGLPECSGIALGLDRLLMIMVGAESLQEVIAFPVDRA